MRKFCKTLKGKGKLFCENKLIRAVNYKVDIYQNMVPSLPGQPLLESLFEIEGSIDVSTPGEFWDYSNQTVKLEVDNGSFLECLIDTDGRILGATGQELKNLKF
jgi:hypothetical protein